MKKRKASNPKTATAPQVLREELTLLDLVLQEFSKSYVNRLQREIQSVTQSLGQVEAKGEFTHKQLKDVKSMLEAIRQLEVKPVKGRRKDLKKIDALIGQLEGYTDKW
jgi:conjugal transfer/entry exclusion protein